VTGGADLENQRAARAAIQATGRESNHDAVRFVRSTGPGVILALLLAVLGGVYVGGVFRVKTNTWVEIVQGSDQRGAAVIDDEVSALERRREQLRRELDELARANQAQRMQVLLGRRDNITVIAALAIALGIGIAVRAIWLPTIHTYLVVCR
jgi:hypothetical protein